MELLQTSSQNRKAWAYTIGEVKTKDPMINAHILKFPVLLLEDVLKYAGLISSFLKLKLGGKLCLYQLPEILYEYAKLISLSAYGGLQLCFITDRFKKLRDWEITISGTIRE